MHTCVVFYCCVEVKPLYHAAEEEMLPTQTCQVISVWTHTPAWVQHGCMAMSETVTLGEPVLLTKAIPLQAMSR